MWMFSTRSESLFGDRPDPFTQEHQRASARVRARHRCRANQPSGAFSYDCIDRGTACVHRGAGCCATRHLAWPCLRACRSRPTETFASRPADRDPTPSNRRAARHRPHPDGHLVNGFIVDRGSGGVELRLGPSSGELQRTLGPVAFNALVTIAVNASYDNGGHWIVRASSRSIAEDLDIGKERAAAALRILRNRGILVLRDSRTSNNARFAPSVYELRIDSPEPQRAERPSPTAVVKPGRATKRVNADDVRDDLELRLFGDA